MAIWMPGHDNQPNLCLLPFQESSLMCVHTGWKYTLRHTPSWTAKSPPVRASLNEAGGVYVPVGVCVCVPVGVCVCALT